MLKFLIILFIFSCNSQSTETRNKVEIDADQLLSDISFLSSDELEGRRTGTEGNRLAREFIIDRFTELNLSPFEDSFEQHFELTNPEAESGINNAVNIVGQIKGSLNSGRNLVVTAHYDHLGTRDGEVFNGADDNASGVAALLTAAQYFSQFQPLNSILFIAFDAEEMGLQGARYFVEYPVVPLRDITLVVNMDMISTNFKNELYAVGTYHYPFLKPMIEQATADAAVDVLFGYDSESWPQNWTFASDHGPFHAKGIPFIYFGVEDHEHYHEPSDIFENINPEFYVNAVEAIIGALSHMDRHLHAVADSTKE